MIGAPQRVKVDYCHRVHARAVRKATCISAVLHRRHGWRLFFFCTLPLCVPLESAGQSDHDTTTRRRRDDNNTDKDTTARTTALSPATTLRPRLVLVPIPRGWPLSSDPAPGRLEHPRSPTPAVLAFTIALSLTRTLNTPSVLRAVLALVHILDFFFFISLERRESVFKFRCCRPTQSPV